MLAIAIAAAAPAVAQPSPPTAVAQPASWPALKAPLPVDPVVEARIDGLLKVMTVEQKVGQIIQGDLASITPDDVYKYHLGSVFNGGNSSPGNDEFGPASGWLAAADAFYDASMRPDGKLVRIPAIWGSDAVHGHNNIVGATLFPHNIGLGATRDPGLVGRIGAATALEMRVTGLDWTFAPTLTVVRDDRWGRTYEGFGEHPEITASFAGPLVEGLQGRIGSADWLKGAHIIATAKHFLGDGGTAGGKDQGDTLATEAQLRDTFAAGYPPALAAGVQSVMASFSSWNGVKLHGNASLLTGVLKDRWGFDGFVVGDWNGHGQVPGCTVTHCAASATAGLDLYMAPDSWKGLWQNTVADVKSGALPMARLDDAVRRILRVKIRAGVFEAGRPSTRPHAGDWSQLASPAHRALAREAVRKSLVLLKNDGGVLPLRAGARILVAGDGADNVAKQAGGWTLTWQGTGTKPEHFPNAQSIWRGIAETVKAGGGSAELAVDGIWKTKPDAAIVVFGEDPYAEFQGDRADVAFNDTRDTLAMMKRLRAAGIPVVAVFLSGRPLWVNREVNAADAFVAAWLPGSEGGGVADVLFGKADFTGKLPYSWPRRADQVVLNVGDADYQPLFAYGFGRSARDAAKLAPLSEDGPAAMRNAPGVLFTAGRATTGRQLFIATAGLAPQSVELTATLPSLTARAADRRAQEDSRRFTWTGPAQASVLVREPAARDLQREANGELALIVGMRVDAAPTAPVALLMRCGDGCAGSIDITAQLAAANGRGWTSIAVPLARFAAAGADMARIDTPFELGTAGRLDLTISEVRLGSADGAR